MATTMNTARSSRSEAGSWNSCPLLSRNSEFVSLIKFNGVPILPPVVCLTGSIFSFVITSYSHIRFNANKTDLTVTRYILPFCVLSGSIFVNRVENE